MNDDFDGRRALYAMREVGLDPGSDFDIGLYLQAYARGSDYRDSHSGDRYQRAARAAVAERDKETKEGKQPMEEQDDFYEVIFDDDLAVTAMANAGLDITNTTQASLFTQAYEELIKDSETVENKPGSGFKLLKQYSATNDIYDRAAELAAKRWLEIVTELDPSKPGQGLNLLKSYFEEARKHGR